MRKKEIQRNSKYVVKIVNVNFALEQKMTDVINCIFFKN